MLSLSKKNVIQSVDFLPFGVVFLLGVGFWEWVSRWVVLHIHSCPGLGFFCGSFASGVYLVRGKELFLHIPLEGINT